MADASKRKGLGRGLAALIEDVKPAPSEGERMAAIDQLHANPDQPRKRFDEDELESLAASIRSHGVIQPLVVRPAPDGDGWQIIAGERRWRAAQRAGLHEAPIVVRSFDDQDVLEVAIVENVQRADLNPVEEAQGYAQLLERFGRSQGELAEALGKSRPHIANTMRLLALPEDVLAMLRDGRLSAGHGRALLAAPDPVAAARQVIARGFSVRETEKLAKKQEVSRGARAEAEPDPDTRALEADLTAALGLRVQIQHRGAGAGAVTVRYRNLDELDGLCQLLSSRG